MKDIIRQRMEGEPKILRQGEYKIIHEVRIGAIVNFAVLVDEGEGYVEKQFEKYARTPGTRIIAIKDDKIYLQKEVRHEGSQVDWRLPGGKVVETFAAFKPYLNNPIPEDVVIAGAKAELREEAQLDAEEFEIFTKKGCGATVMWDLYYVVATGIADHHAADEHNEGEEIEEYGWFSFEEVEAMCKSGEIGEGRTVSMLLQFIHQR